MDKIMKKIKAETAEANKILAKYEVKKVNYQLSMSEETPCFMCELWKDGKVVAYCKNDGRGGMTHIQKAGNADVSELNHPGMDIAIAVKVMIEGHRKRVQGRAFALAKGDELAHSPFPMPLSKLKNARNYREWLEKEIKYFTDEGYTVLNTNL